MRIEMKKPNLNEEKLNQQIYYENFGYCPCCKSYTKFIANGEWWRDQYRCIKCNCLPRERALMVCIDKFISNWRELSIHESSPIGRGASMLFKKEAKFYTPTQYYPNIKKGVMHNGYQCEDLCDLSFKDNTFDLTVTQDVMEHVFYPEKAFQEIARTLKPGGLHIFTVPLVNKQQSSEVCAKMMPDGKIKYLREPEYHKNPVSETGSLVTMRWGYDITDYIFESCGLFSDIIFIDNLDLGIRAEFIEVLITRKKRK